VGRWTMVGLGVAIVAYASVACRDEARAPIRIEGRQLTVENLTIDEWLNVEIWLNDHYRVTKARMPAGERLGVPLDVFVAGFGQRFSPARQVVQGIEVTATTARGTPVQLVWGRGRRR
jgi:hypothetical protein